MKMSQNNVFTIAKRNVEGQDMLYQSLKLTNGNWVLNELKIQPGNPNITVRSLFLLNCLLFKIKIYMVYVCHILFIKKCMKNLIITLKIIILHC